MLVKAVTGQHVEVDVDVDVDSLKMDSLCEVRMMGCVRATVRLQEDAER